MLLFASGGSDAVSVSAIVISALALIQTIYTKYDARQLAKDKDAADTERARIEATFDTKFSALEADHRNCEENHLVQKQRADAADQKLQECEERHTMLESRVDRLEAKTS